MPSRSPTYWNDVADRWVETRPQRLWRAHSDRVNAHLLEIWLGPAPVERALKTDCFDEGVGDAGVYPSLARGARAVVGIDLSGSVLRSACARHPKLLAAGADVCRLPFAEGSFDFVFSNSTLDHLDSLEDVAAGLGELHRTLRPGGRLLLTLDNPWNPVVAVRNALPPRFLARTGLVPYHVGATCGPRRLARLVRDAGFEIDWQGASVHCPRLPAIAVGSLLDRIGSPRARETFLRFLGGWEALERWPTRFLSGYFIAVSARRP